MSILQSFVTTNIRGILQEITGDYQTQSATKLMRETVFTVFRQALRADTLTDAVAIRTGAKAWGYFPLLSLIVAFGVFLLALANNAARIQDDWATPLFWIGFIVIIAPVSLRMLWPTVSRRERLGLIVALTAGLYMLRLLNAPAGFTGFDEFLHWRTANDILTTKHLFSVNSLLPVSPLYPGLEIATSAVAGLSGLSVFDAGILLIGVVRLMFVVALFLFFERISKSGRIAGLAVIFYMGNSNFIFFNANYGYESLALGLLPLILLVESRLENSRDHSLMYIVAIVIPVAIVIAMTHHMTSYFLSIYLVLFAVMKFLKTPHSKSWMMVLLIAGITVGASSLWTSAFVGDTTSKYLLPSITGGVNELIQLITGESSGRQLFEAEDGVVSPLLERLAGMGSVALITLGLPIGFLQVWRRLNNPRALALGLATVGFPLSIAFRFTKDGWELANRSSEFLFIAVGFVLAVGVVGFWQGQSKFRLQALAIASMMVVIIAGGFIAGSAPYERLPGPYMVAADARSVEPLGIQTAEWTKQYLGEGNRFGADRTNRNLLAVYGNQWPITGLSDKPDTTTVFTEFEIGPDEKTAIRDTHLEFLLVDTRLTTARPVLGMYFEQGEPPAQGHKVPLRLQALLKFDGIPLVSRPYDNGVIVIYDIRKYREQLFK